MVPKIADMSKKNVILCGFMGTGKSSVGRCLADLIDYTFLDLDTEIEAEAGMSIPDIFSSQGEPAFRALESNMVERAAEKTRHVIAAGGGAIVNPKNLENLRRCGVIVTLTADVQTILNRVGTGDDRPMLQQGNRLQRIRELMEKRKSAYAKADIVLDTSPLSIDDVAHKLVERLRDFGFALD
jgi:shikimate kinase